ncbi:MAG: TetR/AcrR family transcriptional regulator [Solirubrobacteraceae bacterium]|nr:TetR/AcrR family transcriptional regulator [Solirubrobacteraceae bacterium]
MAPGPEQTSTRRYGGLTASERDLERRRRLLNAGLDAFGTVGYAATSVDALCAAAGVSTRNFYDHFSGRESLLIAVFDDGVAQARDATLEALGALPPDASVRERTHAGLTAFAERMLGDERQARINFVEVVGASRTVEEHRRTAIRSFAEIFFHFAELLASEGVITARPRHFFKVGSIALVGAVVEALLEWMTQEEHERVPLAEVIEVLVELVGVLSGEPA